MEGGSHVKLRSGPPPQDLGEKSEQRPEAQCLEAVKVEGPSAGCGPRVPWVWRPSQRTLPGTDSRPLLLGEGAGKSSLGGAGEGNTPSSPSLAASGLFGQLG